MRKNSKSPKNVSNWVNLLTTFLPHHILKSSSAIFPFPNLIFSFEMSHWKRKSNKDCWNYGLFWKGCCFPLEICQKAIFPENLRIFKFQNGQKICSLAPSVSHVIRFSKMYDIYMFHKFMSKYMLLQFWKQAKVLLCSTHVC